MNMKHMAHRKMKTKPNFDVYNKIVEESAELIVAIQEMKKKATEKRKDHILEEMSDVVFCIHCYLEKEKIPFKYLDHLAHEKGKKRFPEEF